MSRKQSKIVGRCQGTPIGNQLVRATVARCCTLMLRNSPIFGSSRAPLTSRLDKDFGPLPPIVCLFLPSDFLLMDVAPFLKLVHGTTYLRTLPHDRLCLHLNNDEKCSYFVAPPPVLLSRSFRLWSLK